MFEIFEIFNCLYYKVVYFVSSVEARLDRFNVLVGDTQPSLSRTLNSSSYNKCAEYSGSFGAGATVKLPCEHVVQGRFLVIYIPGYQFLTLCEVQVFGDRGKVHHLKAK